jgi:hypothetical protein
MAMVILYLWALNRELESDLADARRRLVEKGDADSRED